MEILCHIELMRRHRSLGISHIFPIYIHLQRSLNRTKVEENLFAFKVLRQGKGTPVVPDLLHGVVDRGDLPLAAGDGAWEGARVIIGHTARILRLPDGGDGNGPPGTVIKIRPVKIRRLPLKTALPVEFPFPVERHLGGGFRPANGLLFIAVGEGDHVPLLLIPLNHSWVLPVKL